MTWSSAQFLAWGPAPGWGTPPLDGTKPLHELLGYRGLSVDPPGYIQQGLRAYDTQVGRWLSPDPMGHAASLSLYDYCDNDPLNVFDSDGRFGKGVSSGTTGSVSSSSPSSAAFNIGMTLGGGISGAGSGAVGGAHIVNNSLSFGLSDSFGWTQSYSYQGSQYTASRVLADVGRESLVAAATLGVGNALTATTRAGVTTAAAKTLKLPATDATIAGSKTLGYTTPNGSVFLQPALSRSVQASTLRHEGVHSFFSPKGSGSVATFRQNLGQWGYDNSQLLRFTEEAIAETYGSGSLIQGLRHPLMNGYGISAGGLSLEGGAIGGGILGAGYLGYQLGGGGN